MRGSSSQRHAQRAAKGLENGLGLMVGIVARQVVDVQRDQRVIDKALKNSLTRSTSNSPMLSRTNSQIEHQAGTAGDIQHRTRQGFIQRTYAWP